MSEVRKTAKYAAIYAIGVILNRIVSFIMLPIYTRYLTPADYGTLELLTLTIDIIAMLVGIGLTSAVFRFYYMYEDQKQRNQVISTITMIAIACFFVASCIGVTCAEKFSVLVFGSKDNSYYFLLMFLALFFQALVEMPLTFIIAQQRPFLFVAVSIIKLIIQLSLNIYFVVFLQMKVLGILYSTLISFSVVGPFLILYTFRAVGINFSRKLARAMIIFGAPFIISNIGDFILTFSDRYFLKAYADLTDVGIYSLGYKFGFVLWFLVAKPVFNIWDPQRFEIATKPNAQEIYQRVFFYFSFLLISGALGISLFGRDLFRVMSNPSFWDAYKIIPLIMVAYIIQAWTIFGNFGLLYKARTKHIASGTFIAAISIIILSFLLIPIFEGYGAAFATVIAFLIRFLIIYYFSQKEYRLKLPWLKTLMMLATAVTICSISFCFQQDKLLLSIGQNASLFLAFVISIFVFPVFDSKEKMFVFGLIRHPLASFPFRGSIWRKQ